jgi:hypothetical protein
MQNTTTTNRKLRCPFTFRTDTTEAHLAKSHADLLAALDRAEQTLKITR